MKNTIGTIIEGIKSGNKNMLDNKSINDLFKFSSQNKNVINIDDKKPKGRIVRCFLFLFLLMVSNSSIVE